MTSRLAILRSQLGRLRRFRARLRLVAACSALAIGVLVCLAAFVVLDLTFEMEVVQRCVVLALAAAALAWTYRRYARPLLSAHEDELEMALLVQRDQGIDSDLVAALQFEQPQAERRGSPQLQSAVIDYVAAAGHGIALRDQDLRRAARQRLTLAGLLVALAAAAAALWPAHAAALAHRLLLSSAHYPTRTTINRIVVNRALLLDRSADGSQPRDGNAAEGQPLTFLVQCSGQLPDSGSIALTMLGPAQRRSRIKLAALSLDQRQARLQTGLQQVTRAIEKGLSDLPLPEREELQSQVGIDSPAAAALLNAGHGQTAPLDLPAVAQAIARSLEGWPGKAAETALLMGRLEQLHSSVQCRIFAGDAWTEPATIHMIPLPIVQLDASPAPPEYAAGRVETPSSNRQFVVLEGSSLKLGIRCVNGKVLTSAWIVVQGRQAARKFDLVPAASDKTHWTLPSSFPPLENIREELRFEIQVIDTDGLSLETPVRGTVRVTPDRPPLAVAGAIHRLVLPAGTPLLHYRASDDFGIAGLTLVVEIERAADAQAAALPAGVSAPAAATAADASTAAPERRYELLTTGGPVRGSDLPLVGKFPLPLADLPLSKGDRLKLTLEATDFRGQNGKGTTSRADPVVLEVSDEAGVLAAIAEADPRSAEILNELISRELMIGENP